MNKDLRSKLATTEMLILDVDGVLTDGRLFFGSGGIEMKAFNVHDGYGLKKIQLEGISIANRFWTYVGHRRKKGPEN